MAISHLKIKSFRNHKDRTFNFNRAITVIFGDNGSGKTSILEAIHLLSVGKSFKTSKKTELIRRGEDQLVLNGYFIKKEIETRVSTLISKKSKQKIKINGKNLFKRKDLLGKNSVVLLSPEEQKISKGAAKERRFFFDKLFSITSQKYLINLQDYTKTIKQRNTVLKSDLNIKKVSHNLKIWDEILIEKGLNLWNQRVLCTEKFNRTFTNTVKDYDKNIKAEISYNRKNIERTEYNEKIKNNKERDFFLKRTTFGPHTDDFTFLWNDKIIRNYGSEGEHKTFLILLKLTELKYIEEVTGEQPILLLDDLFATIDLDRSKKTISILKKIEREKEEPIQTIITTTDLLNLKKTNLNLESVEKEVIELRR